MKPRFHRFGLFLALALILKGFPANADSITPFTATFNNLTAGPDLYHPVYSDFAFPRFDSSLGSLQSVNLAFNFSGTVAGSASGVSQSSSFDSTIDHWVFFDFEDVSDGVAIAEPNLHLAADIPAGAQNAEIQFGPENQSSNLVFSVTSGDPRFDAWCNGPGHVSASLAVSFSNTTQNDYGLNFFSGTDSGVYSGSFSLTYDFVPVPEPGVAGLCAAGGLLLLCLVRQLRK